MSNVVFFGQADAGKSTLAGYIISRYDKEFKLSKFIESMIADNPKCDISLAFSAIMNTNKDEVENSRHLNSKSLHLRKIQLPFEKVTIIDTPGSENYRKQRERGMYYGNVGIFFMEINNVLEHKYKIDTIAPIALWSKLEKKRMIFILTKLDLIGYSEDAYFRALREVEDICGYFGFNDNYTVIPTAIEVERISERNKDELDGIDLGENICSKSSKMPWFNGQCLIDTIKGEIDDLDKMGECDPLVFCVTDQVDRPNSKAGKVWNIKILSGIMRVGQEIYMAPVKDTNNNFRVLRANVKQLRSDISRYDSKENVPIARAGEIYGLDIKNCSMEKRHASKSEYNAIASTCGFNSDTRFSMSDSFSFEVGEIDLPEFEMGKEMRLVWFGRSLPFFVREVDGCFVRGQLKNTQIAFPVVNLSKSILIKGTDAQDFYNAKLLGIG
ncbi:GTP-binding protein [Candidatus Ventrimonas sp. KK005]